MISQNSPTAAWKESIWRNKLKYFVWEMWGAGWWGRATFSSLYCLHPDGKYWACGLTSDQRNLLCSVCWNDKCFRLHTPPDFASNYSKLSLGLPGIGFTWREWTQVYFCFHFHNENILPRTWKFPPRISRIPKVFILGSPGKMPSQTSLIIHSVYIAV